MPRPLPPALQALLPQLRCPVCAESLADSGSGLCCARGHGFDLARGGHVSLLAGRGAPSGDDDAMARARDRFLATGAYAPLREALIATALADDAPDPRRVLDIGCGSGWYLAGLLDRVPGAHGLGIDTSSRSLRFAARAHPRAAAVAADVFAPLPLATGSTDLVLDVFSPRNPPEFARVLRPGGRLLVSRPAPDHLAELRREVPGMVGIDPRKEERLREALDPHFRRREERTVRFPAELDAAAAADLVGMTPSARHVAGETATVPDGLRVTVAVVLGVYEPREPMSG